MSRLFGLLAVLVICAGCVPTPSDAPPKKTSVTTSPSTTPNEEVPTTPAETPSKSPPAKTFTPVEDKDLAALKDVPIDDLLAKLADEMQRTLAARALAARGAAAVDPLIKALDHQDPQTRAAAAFALGQLGKEAAAAKDRLQQMATSDDSEVAKDAAAFALDAVEGN